jgi:hypothetical protein
VPSGPSRGRFLAAGGQLRAGPGFTTHQPLISRVGVFITGLATIVFAGLAVRARHSRVLMSPGREALSESQHDS